jgi:hypothetical protein
MALPLYQAPESNVEFEIWVVLIHSLMQLQSEKI